MDAHDDMPPVDEELRRAMETLTRKQELCRRVHLLLIFLSVVCFWNVVGVTALFANVLVAALWPGRLPRREGLWAAPFAKLFFIKEVPPWNFSKRKS